MAQKPVVKWNPEETCQWLKELGEWTEVGLVPYFRDRGISMSQLVMSNNDVSVI